MDILWDDHDRISKIAFWFASVSVSNPTVASIRATGNRKFQIVLTGTMMSRANYGRPFMLPIGGPDPANPIFSIAGGKWLGATTSIATGHAFIQYFDE